MRTSYIIHHTSYICLLLLAAACVYEYPDDRTPGTSDAVELTLELELNIDFEIDAEHTEAFVQNHNALLAEGYAIRYIVDLHRQPDNSELPLPQRTHRLIATETAMPPNGVYRFSEVVTLTAARYVALVWVDFVPAGSDSDSDYYYHTDNLQAVTIDRSRPYRGYHISKDAFTNAMSINLTSVDTRSVSTTVRVMRPFALYRIVATDVAEYRTAHSANYATVRPDTTRLSYQGEFPMGFNAYHSVPARDNFAGGVHYAYACGVPYPNGDKEEMELAADFVFVKGSGDSYYVDFSVETPAGARINRHRGQRVNLQRNRMTVIRDAFLTTGSSGGGTGIDFRFKEEIVVKF